MPILAEGVPRKIADPFDYGSGNINPNRAADPGLIYDIDPTDYNKFFACTIKTSASCNATMLPRYHLNLPSIAVPDLRDPTTGVKMVVEPSVLVFDVGTMTTSQ
jgi:hypothetical protein